MAVDLFVILYEAMAGAIFILLLVLLVLIPSKRKVREGRAGSTMKSPLVPALIIIALIVSVLMVPLAVLLSKKALILVLSSAFMIPASVITYWDYLRTKRLLKEVSEGRAGTIAVDELPLEQASPTPSAAGIMHPGPSSDLLTVECPRCKGRIEVHPSQSSLRCPYCGLSGSL